MLVAGLIVTVSGFAFLIAALNYPAFIITAILVEMWPYSTAAISYSFDPPSDK